MDKDVRGYLRELRERANNRRINPELKHTPTKKEIEIANQNARDMQYEQYLTISKEDEEV